MCGPATRKVAGATFRVASSSGDKKTRARPWLKEQAKSGWATRPLYYTPRTLFLISAFLPGPRTCPGKRPSTCRAPYSLYTLHIRSTYRPRCLRPTVSIRGRARSSTGIPSRFRVLCRRRVTSLTLGLTSDPPGPLPSPPVDPLRPSGPLEPRRGSPSSSWIPRLLVDGNS